MGNTYGYEISVCKRDFKNGTLVLLIWADYLLDANGF